MAHARYVSGEWPVIGVVGYTIVGRDGGFSGTYRPSTSRPFAIRVPSGDFLRDARGRIRTFSGRREAEGAAKKAANRKDDV